MKEPQVYLNNVKDHTVTNESFALCVNTRYGFLETKPKPIELSGYYKSEDYISHTDRAASFFEKTYQAVKSKTIKLKVKRIQNATLKGATVLDFGCGTGDFLVGCKNAGFNVLGFEPNSAAGALSKKKGVELILSIENLKDNSVDVITLWHVLEHLPNLEKDIAQFKRVLKPNGTLIIAVPNYKSFDAKWYKQFWAAYDVPRHLRHFDKKSINNLFSTFQFSLQNTNPMWFDAFYVAMLSEKIQNNSLSFIKGIFIGFLSNASGMLKKEFSSHIYTFKND